MEALTPPQTITLTDYEFIFLGGTKLSHTLRPDDKFEDQGDHFRLTWVDVSEDALIYKGQLLQLGRRVRIVTTAEQTAVQKVVADIKAREAKAQGAQGRTQTPVANSPFA